MTARTMSPTLPAPSPYPVEPAQEVPAARARIRDALRVLAYAVEQGWVIIRPTMVEVLAGDLAPVERRWLLAGIGPIQVREGLIAGRVTVEGMLIGRLIRVHLPDTSDSLRLIRKVSAQ